MLHLNKSFIDCVNHSFVDDEVSSPSTPATQANMVLLLRNVSNMITVQLRRINVNIKLNNINKYCMRKRRFSSRPRSTASIFQQYLLTATLIGGTATFWYFEKIRKQTSNLPPLNPPFVKVTPINTGTLAMQDSIMIENGSEDIINRVTVLSYLIQHPLYGATLFDLGFNEEVFKENYGKLSKHGDFLDLWSIELDKTGFKSLSEHIEKVYNINRKDIKNLIISHFHWDHCGNAEHFPNAKIIMGKGVNKVIEDVCITCSKKHDGFFGFELPINKEIIEVEWNNNCKIGPFNKTMDVYGDGTLYIVPGPGHVPGHIMAIAKHEKGYILLAADGVYSSQSYNGNAPRKKGLYNGNSADQNPKEAFETICKIHQFYNLKNTMVRQAHFESSESYKI